MPDGAGAVVVLGLEGLGGEFLGVGPGALGFEEEELEAGEGGSVGSVGWVGRGWDSLAVFDDVCVERREFLEIAPFSVGHLQGRPEAVGAVGAVLPVA